jgi:uncharacterized protein (TIGR03435 family)
MVWKNVTLRPIVLRAFGIKSYQLIGPSSLDAGPYEIVAKLPSDTTKETFDLMLQELLITRFGLEFRREARQLPIYEVVIASGGLKMKAPAQQATVAASPGQAASVPDGSRNNPLRIQLDKSGMLSLPPGIPKITSLGLNGIMFVSARMKTLGDLLRAVDPYISRIVVDKTDLTGSYDYAIKFEPEVGSRSRIGTASAAAQSEPKDLLSSLPGSEVPRIREALERQLGLKLEDRVGPVQVVVVDRVNRRPTEN